MEMFDPKTLEPHALALVFPPIPDAEMAELAADLGKNGMHEPIDLYEGKVLDGWHRTQASITAGLEQVPTRLYAGDDPQSYVLSKNKFRRHLTNDQRAMIAAKMANMERGTRTDLVQSGTMSVDDAAKNMKTSRRQTFRARGVLKADPIAAAEVATGKIKLSDATKKIADKRTKKTADKYTGRQRAKPTPAPAAEVKAPRLHCSFCDKSQDDVQRMIAGQMGSNICSECMERAADNFRVTQDNLEAKEMAKLVWEFNPGLALLEEKKFDDFVTALFVLQNPAGATHVAGQKTYDKPRPRRASRGAKPNGGEPPVDAEKVDWEANDRVLAESQKRLDESNNQTS